jgi:hypothetical protein
MADHYPTTSNESASKGTTPKPNDPPPPPPPPKSDSVTEAKVYDALQAGIKRSDEISFKLLGLVPLVNGAAIVTAVLGTEYSNLPSSAFVMLSFFGAFVTLGLFWWELRNIQYCLWYIKLAKPFEEPILKHAKVPDGDRERPRAPGNVGKRGAEKLIYSIVILTWLALPVALGKVQLPNSLFWTVLGIVYVVLIVVAVCGTLLAVVEDVEHPDGVMRRIRELLERAANRALFLADVYRVRYFRRRLTRKGG